MSITYVAPDVAYSRDAEADAIYVRLSNAPRAYTVELDDDRLVDYSTADQPIGIELLNVSAGVKVAGLPRENSVVEILQLEHLPLLAAEES